MRVLVANPPWFPSPLTWGLRGGAAPPRAVPAGHREVPWPARLAELTGFLLANGHDGASLVDSIATRESLDGWLARLQQLHLDAVVFAAEPAAVAADLELIEAAGRLRPVIVLWPGDGDGGAALLDLPGVRAVVCGEAERGVLAALAIDEPTVWPADPLENIDDLPFPFRDHSLGRYRPALGGAGPWLPVAACRGPERWHSLEWLAEDIARARRDRPELTGLWLVDPRLNANPERFAELAEWLAAEGWPWAGRVALGPGYEPELLRFASSAVALEVAVEGPLTTAAEAELERLRAAGVALATREVQPEPSPSVRQALLAAGAAAPTDRRPDIGAIHVVGQHQPVYMPPWLTRAAAELGYPVTAVDLFADPRQIRILLDSRPEDVILVDRGLGLPAELVAELPGRTVLYSPEVLPTLEGASPHAERRYAEFLAIAPAYDAVVLHDAHALEFLRAEGHRNIVGCVMLPFEPRLHRDLALERTVDVLFVGHASEHRQDWLEGLRAEGIEVAWPQVWGHAFVRALNRAKIVLNLHYTPHLNTEQRIVEALACGCFVVSEPLTEPALFRDGEHLVMVTRATAADIIRHYLAHPAEREAIARAGQAYVAGRHTARHCLRELLDLALEAL